MKNFFKSAYLSLVSLDKLGPSPSLNFNGNDRYNSFFGFLLTIITFLIASFIIKFTLLSFWNQNNPDVYEMTEYDEGGVRFDPNITRFYINIFSLDQSFIVSYIDPSELSSPILNSYIQNNTGNYMETIGLMENCDDEFFVNFRNQNFNKFRVPENEFLKMKLNSFCFPKNFSMVLELNNNKIQQLLIGFPFQNFKKLLNIYENLYLSMTYQIITLNPNNFTNWYSEIWNQEVFRFEEDQMQGYLMEFEHYNIVKDQTKFIFSDTINSDLINIKKFSKIMDLKTSSSTFLNMMGMLVFSKSSESTGVLIKYKSVNDILSEFGGTFELLKHLAEFILNVFICKHYYSDLINSIFKFHFLNKEEPSVNYKIYKNNLIKNFDMHVKKKNIEDKLNISHTDKKPSNENMREVSASADIPHENIKLNINNFIINNKLFNDNFQSANQKIENKNESIVFIDKNVFELFNLFKVKQNLLKRQKLLPIEYVKMKLCCFKKKYNSDILKHCEMYIDKYTSINKIVSFGLEFNILKKVLFTKLERKYISHPSLNIAPKCELERVEKKVKTSEREVDIEDLHSLLDKNLRKNRKNSEILKLFFNNFL